MAFPPQFLEELRARLPLSEVAGRRMRLVRAGREYKAPCPFHNEKTPSFTINDQKGFFHCFGCGAHGDVIGFVMRLENLSFPEAVEWLAGQAGLTVPTQNLEEREKFARQKSLYDLLEQTTRWFEQQLYAPAGRAGLEYFRRRGLDEESMARFRLGFAPMDAQALRQHLTKAGYDDAMMAEAGVMKCPEDGRPAYAFFRNRVIFPVSDRRGRVVAFGARLLEGEGPKYINTSETPLFHKGQMLYGMARARQAAADGQPLVVVEGYMDVIACVRAGWHGAVAPLGTALTETQVLTLWKLAPLGQRVPVLCFDGDTAGRRAAWRAVERILPHLMPDHSVRFAFLPDGEDPDSLLRSQGTRAFQAVLDQALSLADMVWDLERQSRVLDTPEARAGLQAALEERCQSIADSAVRSFYLSEMRQRIGAAFSGWRGSGGPPQSRYSPYSPAAGGGRRYPRGQDVPRAPLTRTRPKSVGHLRARILLATLINNPYLFEEFGEDMVGLAFDDESVEHLWHDLVTVLSEDSALDADTLCRHLCAHGHEAALSGLRSDHTYLHAAFARPGTAPEQVRAGWRDVVRQGYRREVQAELKAAERQLGRDPTEANFARVVALRQEALPDDTGDEDDSAGL